MAFARHQAQLAQPIQGRSQRAHLEVAARRGVARAIAALDGPPLPEPLAYLWDWFLELNAARSQGVDGPAPLSFPDIDAWARLTGRTPEPYEVRALLQLDAVIRRPVAEADEVPA